jgi:cytoskeletal protein CcmA (bactofilin family)
MALCATPIALSAQADNTYMAGAEVRIEQPLAGDLIAAAGRLAVDSEVTGDALLGAGSIEVRAPLRDDLRAAGGIVHLYNRVEGEALIAGGSVTVDPSAQIGRHAWIAGVDVTIAGRLGGGLKAYGRHVTIAGDVQGPVVVSGQRVEIAETARIHGDVRYSSRQEIAVHPGARIAGAVTRMPGALDVPKPEVDVPFLPALRPLLLLGLFAAGTLLYWIFPRFTVTSSRILGAAPVKSLGLGAGIFFSGPPVILLLVITIIGIPIAVAITAAYAIALLAGYLVCAFFLGERGWRLMRDTDPTTRWRLLSLALALVLLALLREIPYVGALVTLLAVILGVGAMVLQAFTHYSDRART